MMMDVGPANQAFIHATETLLLQFCKWEEAKGEEYAMRRWNHHNQKWIDGMQKLIDAGHEPDLAERAMLAAIQYASLLISAGEL